MPRLRLPASVALRVKALQQRIPVLGLQLPANGDAGGEASQSGLHRSSVDQGEGEAAVRARPDAGTDSLTGLPDRTWLMAYLRLAIEAAAGGGGSMAFLFIDLDDFKSVNERCGRDGGDALLRAAAVRLGSTIRTGDTLARLGGDEFMVVLEGVEQAEVALVAGRIIEAMATAFGPGSPACAQVRASVGISLYPRDGATLAVLLRHADLAMYMAKSGGKGRYAFHAAAGGDHPSGGLPPRRGRSRAVSSG
jgi:diguanylate cyclase (GGDEF)-like protein